MSSKVLSIGPGAIAEPGTKGGPNFSLSKTEWVAIQTYVTDALALPITNDEFRKSLGSGAPKDLADFVRLIDTYKGIHDHSKTWQDTTFPKTVALANAVVQYGRNTAPVYYPPILTEAKKLITNPDDQEAKAALKAILDALQKEAQKYAGQADAAAKEVKQFVDDTQADKDKLVGPKGDDGLVKYYNDKYGKASKEVEELTQEIKAQRLVLKGANAEYDQDVIIATTTPTYVWIFPIGTIAAAVVAGVYGDKAVKALERARAAQRKIDELSDKIAADANLMNSIHLASFGMNYIARSLSTALPVIQKIYGVWGGIASDIGQIVTLIDTNIREVPPIIMNLGVELAIKSWANVASAADAYRVNAYVKESGLQAQTMPAWRVGAYLTSETLVERRKSSAA
jgi:Bacillus haemolytic enterotoxin (HBL)